MFKCLLLIAGLILFLSIVIGCGHLIKVSIKNKKELSAYENKESVYNNNLGKTLVVYYSLSGNTKQIAENIAKKTGADLFEIKTIENIKSGASFYLDIKKQLKSKNYPQIEDNLPEFSNYDTVFVGFPVWWYTIATPGLKFLQKANFKHKKVVPFSTQGSNYGSFYKDFNSMAQNANVVEGRAFNNVDKKYDKAVDNKITDWLNSI